jgi:ubiquinone/menaquinone biosynthesis C-methylase UbiE
VDIAEEGIHWAQEFAGRDPDHLLFQTADMAAIDFPPNSFDAIILIDAIYFILDLPALLKQMLSWLTPTVHLYIFYSAWVDDASRRYLLRPDGTPLAQALQALSLAYDIRDYSDSEAAHWQLKRQVAEEMNSEFEAQGNDWLQHRRWLEAESHRQYVENGSVSRYLYRIGRPISE